MFKMSAFSTNTGALEHSDSEKIFRFDFLKRIDFSDSIQYITAV